MPSVNMLILACLSVFLAYPLEASFAVGDSFVNVADYFVWDENFGHWNFDQDMLVEALRTLNRTKKTAYFPAGQYNSKDPVKLDFAEIWTDEYADKEGLHQGVRFVGEAGASKIQMGNYVNQTDPAFWITWSSPDPNANRGVFHWEFVGVSWAGGTDHTLLKFGPKVAWNSCKFELSVNNGFKGNDTEDSERGTAVGVFIDWPLQSTISVDATCAKGTGIRLEAAEFSTIMGSFSNTDSNVNTLDGRHQITANSVGLWMRGCQSNTFLAVNCEVNFFCIVLDGFTWGNVFNSIVETNCDARGAIFVPQVQAKLADPNAPHNIVKFLNKRGCRQGYHGVTPPTLANRTVEDGVHHTYPLFPEGSIGVENMIEP